MKTVLFLLIFIGFGNAVFAMHEMDHRYTILGYVRNEQGDAKADIPVTIEHKGGQKQQTKTNPSGYYESLFHLHDGNLGDEMIVTVGSEIKTIVTVFDPKDKFADRKSQVDFGAKEKEQPLLYYVLGGGGVLLLCMAIYFSIIKKKKQSLKKEKRKK